MSRIYWIAAFLVLCQTVSLRAETYTLTSGEILLGEVLPSSAKNEMVQFRLDDGTYRTVSWGKFSQDTLKKLARIPRLAVYADAFITPPVPLKPRKVFVPHLKEVGTLMDRPQQGGSLLGALFSTPLGLLALLALYAANIYAGYEVAIFRMRPPVLVAGLAAIPVLGFIATLIFLSLPSERLVAAGAALEEAGVAELAQPLSPLPAEPTEEGVVNPMQSDTAPHPAGLKLAHSEASESTPQHPQTVVYQRGQFTFNRRFFETKFGGFFGVVRRDAERDMVLVIKAARGEYTGNRITRIAANDLHLQVQRGPASEEVMIPFGEIMEIRLKHKDAVA